MQRRFRRTLLAALMLSGTIFPAQAAESYLVDAHRPVSQNGNGETELPLANFDAVDPAVAVIPESNQVLIVWSAEDADTVATTDEEGEPVRLADDEFEIFGRLFDTRTEEPGGVQFRISVMGNDDETDPDERRRFDALNPAVAWNPISEEFLVVWEGDDDTAPLVEGEFEIFGQRIDRDGETVGDRFRISVMGDDAETDPAERARYGGFRPAVAVDTTTGDYLVSWHGDDNQAAAASGATTVDEEMEIFGRIISADGSPAGEQFRISTMGDDTETDADERARFDATHVTTIFNPVADNFVVAWQGDDNNGALSDDEFEIYAQQVGNTGTLQGGVLRISAMGPDGDAAYGAFEPALALDPASGTVLVTWHGDTNTAALVDDEFEIWGRMLDAGGQPLGNVFRISVMGPDGESDPAERARFDAMQASAAWSPTDEMFLVTWRGDTNANNLVDEQFEVFGRFVHGNGEMASNRFRISRLYIPPEEDDEDNPRDTPEERRKYQAFEPTVAYDAGNWISIWRGDVQSAGGDGRMRVFLRRVARSRTVLLTDIPDFDRPSAPAPIRIPVTVQNFGDVTAKNVYLGVSMTEQFPYRFEDCPGGTEDGLCLVGDLEPEEKAEATLLLETDHLGLGDQQHTEVSVQAYSDIALTGAMQYGRNTTFASASLTVNGGSGAIDWLLLAMLGGLPLFARRKR